MPLETILARRTAAALGHLETLGLSRSEMLRAASLREDELEGQDRRVPVSKYWRLIGYAARHHPEETLGLSLGRMSQAQDWGLVGHAMLYSDTLGQALQRFVRYRRIIVDVPAMKLDSSEGRPRLLISHVPVIPNLPQVADAGVSGFVAMIRQLVGEEFSPAELHLPYPRPVSGTAHREYFRCPLHFEATQLTILFHPGHIDQPCLKADEELVGYLDTLAEQQVEDLDSGTTLLQKLRRTLWRQMSDGQPSIARVAPSLNMSPRSLQRHLRSEGTSFSGVVDELRHSMALVLLDDPNLPVYEIAFLLGYSEPSALFRAFKRWESVSPLIYRTTRSGNPSS